MELSPRVTIFSQITGKGSAMYYNKFKDIEISALGFGSLRVPKEEGNPKRTDRKKGKELLAAAFDCGINYIDTAYTYGDSEEFLGDVLPDFPRGSYYLATKYYASVRRDIREVFEEQLKRCKTDYFDFYMLHSLDDYYINDYMDEKMDCIGFMLEQKRIGRVKYLGFSSHANPNTLRRFLDYCDEFDMAQIQLNYLDWDVLDAKGQYELLRERDIPVWVMEPLKGGRLANLGDEAQGILKATSPNNSAPSWGFRFLMGLEGVTCVLSGMTTPEQIRENSRIFASRNPLSEKEREALETAAKTYMQIMGVPCSACRYCCDTCPAELDIPLLIRGYNQMKLDNALWKVDGLNKAKGPEECLYCETCLSHCPQKIQIPQILAEFDEMLNKRKA